MYPSHGYSPGGYSLDDHFLDNDEGGEVEPPPPPAVVDHFQQMFPGVSVQKMSRRGRPSNISLQSRYQEDGGTDAPPGGLPRYAGRRGDVDTFLQLARQRLTTLVSGGSHSVASPRTPYLWS